MKSENFNSACMVAGGSALAVAAGVTARSISGMEMTKDALDAFKYIMEIASGAGVLLGGAGLLRLVDKYYKHIKTKFNLSDQEMAKIQKCVTKQSTLDKAKNQKRGYLRPLEDGYKKAVVNTPRRSVQNPLSRARIMKKAVHSHPKQSVR